MDGQSGGPPTHGFPWATFRSPQPTPSRSCNDRAGNSIAWAGRALRGGLLEETVEKGTPCPRRGRGVPGLRSGEAARG